MARVGTPMIMYYHSPKSFDGATMKLSTPVRKYDGICGPMHPGLRRCAALE
jgi:hypothetical protein